MSKVLPILAKNLKPTIMKVIVKNTVDPKIILDTNNDLELIQFAEMIKEENEDDLLIANRKQAIYYLNRYCDNLEVIQSNDNYRNYEINKNEFGYYEATDTTDCDALMIHAKTLEGLKIEIDEKLDC